jgi:hypothetical protein
VTPTFTSTRTPTATASPTPTSTPASTVTPTPTVTPTSAPDVVSGIVTDSNGAPVAGARVYVTGETVAITDENGLFTISGLALGEEFVVLVQKTDFTFPTNSFTVRPGSFTAVSGTPEVVNAPGCTTSDVSGTLVTIAQFAEKIRDEIRVLTPQLSKKTRFTLLSGEVISAATLPERAETQYVVFQRANLRVPEVLYGCPDSTTAGRLTLTTDKATMNVGLNDLSHELFLVYRKLRLSDKLKPAKAARLAAALRRERAAVRKLIKDQLPEQTFLF